MEIRKKQKTKKEEWGLSATIAWAIRVIPK